MKKMSRAFVVRVLWQSAFVWVLAFDVAALEVRCAESENLLISAATPASEFVGSSNGVVFDTRTGLSWMRCSLGQVWSGGSCVGSPEFVNWGEALNAAQEINGGGGFGGFSDWRVPNRNELASIIEWRCRFPALNDILFPAAPSSYFWCSTPSDVVGYRKCVDLRYGYVRNNLNPSILYPVLFVRGG